MSVMQNVQPTTSLWNTYPATLIKQVAIGAAAGCIHFFSAIHIIIPTCESSTSELSQYICLRSAKFFEIKNLKLFINPIFDLKDSIAKIVKPIIPDVVRLYAENCELPDDILRLNIPFSKLNNIINKQNSFNIACCNQYKQSSNLIASAFAEELIFRFGIQKIALLSLAKFLPERIGKFLSHPVSRIIIASSIFAFAHKNDFLLQQFLGGLIDGFLFEKYGLLASTISHASNNLAAALGRRNDCEYDIKEWHSQIKKDLLDRW